MSSDDIHDPNGFQQDVQRAIEKVKEKAEDGDVSERDRDDIMAYVNSKYQFVTSDDGLGPGTLRTRIGRLRIFAEATDKPLLDVDGRKEVSRIIGRMSRERGWGSTGTRKNYYKALKGFYRYHERDELADNIKQYISDEIDTPSKTDEVDEEKYPTPEEVGALMDATRTSREKVIVSLLWECAYRVSALCALRVGDYTPKGDSYGIIETPNAVGVKGADGQIKPVTYTRGYLETWLQNDHPCPEDDDAALVCVLQANEKEPGDHMTTQAIRVILNDIAERTDEVDSEKVHPHAFRHGRATQLSNQDYTNRLIEQILDWSKNTDQHDRYDHQGQEQRVNLLLRQAGIEPEDDADEMVEERITCPRCGKVAFRAAAYCPHCQLKLTDEVPKWYRLYQRFTNPDDPVRQEYDGAETILPPVHELSKPTYEHIRERTVMAVFAVRVVSDDVDIDEVDDPSWSDVRDIWAELVGYDADLKQYAENRAEYLVDEDTHLPVEELEDALDDLNDDTE